MGRSGISVRSSGNEFVRLLSLHSLIQSLSLSTLHREYAALVALPYYDLADVILNPKLVRAAIDKREVQASMEKYGVNEPQAGAIVGAINTEGFSLIQG